MGGWYIVLDADAHLLSWCESFRFKQWSRPHYLCGPSDAVVDASDLSELVDLVHASMLTLFDVLLIRAQVEWLGEPSFAICREAVWGAIGCLLQRWEAELSSHELWGLCPDVAVTARMEWVSPHWVVACLTAHPYSVSRRCMVLWALRQAAGRVGVVLPAEVVCLMCEISM